MAPGNYTLRVAGYSDASLLGQIFTNDTELFFDGKEVSVFIQLSKPFYRQGQTGESKVCQCMLTGIVFSLLHCSTRTTESNRFDYPQTIVFHSSHPLRYPPMAPTVYLLGIGVNYCERTVVRIVTAAIHSKLAASNL